MDSSTYWLITIVGFAVILLFPDTLGFGSTKHTKQSKYARAYAAGYGNDFYG